MKNNFYKKTIVLMIVVLLCQAVNLLRDIFLAQSFGASSINDVYLVSQTIISIIISMFNSPMATAFVPVVTKYFVSASTIDRNRFVSTVYCDVFLFAIVLTIIEICAVDLLSYMAAPGFSTEAKDMLSRLIIIQSPITLINILKGINRGNFQILQKFNICEISAIFPYVCMCVYLLLPFEPNIFIVAYILSISTIFSIIPEFIILYRNGIRFYPQFGLPNDIKVIGYLVLAASITTGIREINVMFDKTIGSLLPEGSITMLSYASKLTVVVVGLVSTSVSLVGFSNAAVFANCNEKDKQIQNIEKSLNLINFLIIPIAIFLIVYSHDIVDFLYGGGLFDDSSVKTTSFLMKLYALGLIGYGFQDVFTRNLHAIKNVKCTLKASVLMVFINILLNIVLYKWIGVYGVAIATSVAILSIIWPLSRDIERYIGKYNKMQIAKNCFLAIVASLSSISLVWFFQYNFGDNSFVTLILSFILSFIIYFMLNLLIKNRVIIDIKNEILNN